MSNKNRKYLWHEFDPDTPFEVMINLADTPYLILSLIHI